MRLVRHEQPPATVTIRIASFAMRTTFATVRVEVSSPRVEVEVIEERDGGVAGGAAREVSAVMLGAGTPSQLLQ